MAQPTGNRRNDFRCPECSQDMPNMEMLQVHLQTIHKKQPPTPAKGMARLTILSFLFEFLQNICMLHSQVYSHWLKRKSRVFKIILKLQLRLYQQNPLLNCFLPIPMRPITKLDICVHMMIIFEVYERLDSIKSSLIQDKLYCEWNY